VDKITRWDCINNLSIKLEEVNKLKFEPDKKRCIVYCIHCEGIIARYIIKIIKHQIIKTMVIKHNKKVQYCKCCFCEFIDSLNLSVTETIQLLYDTKQFYSLPNIRWLFSKLDWYVANEGNMTLLRYKLSQLKRDYKSIMERRALAYSGDKGICKLIYKTTKDLKEDPESLFNDPEFVEKYVGITCEKTKGMKS